MFNIFPEFESGQVLTKDELNWLAVYLDSQNRQTRRMLVGCGIVSGLHVKSESNGIRISGGVAVSSAGHILSLIPESGNAVLYNKLREPELKPGEQMAFHFIAEEDSAASDYSASVSGSDLYNALFDGDVLELVPENENGGSPFNSSAANGKVVMLFLEIIQKDLKECEGDNCQEKGKKYLLQAKPYLIGQDAALALLQHEYNTQATAILLEQKAFPWAFLPDLQLLKPAFGKSASSGMNDNTLAGEYRRCIADFYKGIAVVGPAIEAALDNLRAFCGFPAAATKTTAAIAAYIDKSGTLNTGHALRKYQLMYDFLWNYVQAYDEMVSEAQKLRAKPSLLENEFPQHVLLGKAETQNPAFAWQVNTEKSIYRHGFHSRMAQTEQAASMRKLAILLQRLDKIAASGIATSNESTMTLRVTPSLSMKRLSTQAMPYYFAKELLDFWDPASTLRQKDGKLSSYHLAEDSAPASSSTTYNKQPNVFQGIKSFYRIEGVHGKAAGAALSTVLNLRKNFGLPFEVVMLGVSEHTSPVAGDNAPLNEDLVSMYNIVRTELRRQVSLCRNHLGSYLIENVQYDKIKNGLTKAMQQFYINLRPDLIKYLPGITGTLNVKELAQVDSILTSGYRYAIEEKDPMKAVKMEANKITEASFTATVAPAVTTVQNKSWLGDIQYNPRFPLIFEFDWSIFFLNSVGSLVADIRNDKDFAGSSDAAFYSRLLTAVKKISASDTSNAIFYQVLQLHVSLSLLESYLPKSVEELVIEKYSSALNTELMEIAQKADVFFSARTDAEMGRYTLLTGIKLPDLLDTIRRIRYDDDWVKVEQLATELVSRKGGTGVEGKFWRFLQLHPGVAHGSGVCKGGTYILVYNEQGIISADFYLPYALSTNARPLQFALIEPDVKKVVTLDGTVKAEDGSAINAIVTINGQQVQVDAEGKYTASLEPNTKVELTFSAEGYISVKKTIAVKESAVTENVILKKAQEQKFAVTVKFVNADGNLVQQLRLVDKENKEVMVNDVLKLEGLKGERFSYTVADENYSTQAFEILIDGQTPEFTVKLNELRPLRVVVRRSSGEAIVNGVEIFATIDNKNLKFDPQQDYFMSVEKLPSTTKVQVVVLYEGNRYEGSGTTAQPIEIMLSTVAAAKKLFIFFEQLEGVQARARIMVNDKLFPIRSGFIETEISPQDSVSIGGRDQVKLPAGPDKFDYLVVVVRSYNIVENQVSLNGITEPLRGTGRLQEEFAKKLPAEVTRENSALMFASFASIM